MYKPLGVTREMYRRFIEESGLKDSLTEILYRLWDLEEKPVHLEAYVRENFGGQRQNAPNLAHIRRDIGELERRQAELRAENERLKRLLRLYGGPEEEGSADSVQEQGDDRMEAPEHPFESAPKLDVVIKMRR